MADLKRVLVVDDNEGLRESTRQLLEERGYATFGASSAAEAIKIVQESKDEIIGAIIDYRMPGSDGRGKNGIECTREIREIMPNLPIILESAAFGAGPKVLAESAVGENGRVIEGQKPPALVNEFVNMMRRQSKTVLVVEDDEAIRELKVRRLKSNGYTVLEAADGEQALQIWRENERIISGVFTDYAMPRMNGELLAKAIKESPEGKDVPIVLNTLGAGIADSNRLMGTGLFDGISTNVAKFAIGAFLEVMEAKVERSKQQIA